MKFYDMLEKNTQIKRLKNNRGERLSSMNSYYATLKLRIF